jgi:hypothetical protein
LDFLILDWLAPHDPMRELLPDGVMIANPKSKIENPKWVEIETEDFRYRRILNHGNGNVKEQGQGRSAAPG